MCGVAGIWRFKSKVEKNELMSFTDSMHHRGPDGAGYELFENDTLGLGHRRLSILDLSEAGKQPMSYADGRYWLTFNGEIYNFIEIRKELISKGYTFASDSDSEVILASYIEWGVDCFYKFNGMWAIGIWDNNEKQLLLCRDRFGVKPLHYCHVPGELFAFASETIAFRYLKDFNRAYDQDHLIRAMHQHNILEPAGKTIYKHIYQLLPGSYVIIKNDFLIRERKWWKTTDHLQSFPPSFEEQKEKFLSLFADACKLRLRSDVPIASALSGGIDSTAVYCMLNWVMKKESESGRRTPEDWQKAFSISFPGSQVDERKYIQSVLDQTNGKGIITEPRHENLISELEHSTRMSDFISGTPLSSLTYVYKSMHEHGITVSMDGHGVDEYIYGYNSSVSQALVQAYLDGDKNYSDQLEETIRNMNFGERGSDIVNRARQQSVFIAKSDRGIKSGLKRLAKNILPGSKVPYVLPHFNSGGLFSKASDNSKSALNVESYYGFHKNLGEQRLLNEFHYVDLPYNFRDFDRGAMQNQIEIRMPFMDYRLVTYTMALPQKSKLNHGYTKYILREAMKGIMPEDIRTRKLKIGLGAPIKDWFNNGLSSYLPGLANDTKKDVSFLNWNQIKNTIETNCKNKSWTDESAHEHWAVINYLLLEL